MSEGTWKEKNIGDVLTLEYGKPLPASSRNASGKYAVYGANGIKDRSDRFYVEKPSIIVGRKGSAGEITLTEDKFWPLDVTYYVTFDEAKYNLRFLYHLLSLQELTKLAKGVKPGINRNEVYAKKVRIPPLPEQQRIVAVLDAAFAGLEIATTNAEKNLRSARELFVNFLNSIFKEKGENWRRTCIQDVCLSIVDCPNRTAPKLNGPSPFKMIRTTNVRNGRVSLDNVNYVSEATYHRWTRRQVPHRGDVLLTREAPLGEVGMLRTDDKVFLGQRLVSYRANPAELDNHFLLFALRSLDLQRQIKAFGSGATVQHMRVPDTKALLLSLPPLATQKRIVADLYQLLDASDGLAEKYLRKLGQLAQLKQSILQRAFSGELTSVPSETISEAAE